MWQIIDIYIVCVCVCVALLRSIEWAEQRVGQNNEKNILVRGVISAEQRSGHKTIKKKKQLFYVASNQQNKGWKPYFMALHLGFNATLKEVDFEAEVRLIFFSQFFW